MNYLITAGPTREFIDDIRFISNLSSGRMGYALAQAARDTGHSVVLVSGPVALDPPERVRLVNVVSAVEMREAVLKTFPESDIILMCAAVADYRPERRHTGKLKKGPDTLTLKLVKNPDIAAETGARKQSRFLVGFALEAENAEANARSKMAAKNFDIIVLNTPAAMAAESSEVQVLFPDGSGRRIGPAAKQEIAAELIRIIDEIRPNRSRQD